MIKFTAKHNILAYHHIIYDKSKENLLVGVGAAVAFAEVERVESGKNKKNVDE